VTPEQAASAAEGFACPTCGSPAGRPCRTASGNTAFRYHTARFILVEELSGEPEVLVPDDREPGRPWQAPAAPDGDQDPPLEIKIRKQLEVFLADPARACAIGMSPGGRIRVLDAGATFRYDEDGAPRVNFTVQCAQTPDAAHAPDIQQKVLDQVIRRSATIIFDESGWIEYVVTKPLPADDLAEGVKVSASQR